MEQQILAGLIARGVAPHIAQGIVANMIAESGLNPGINEIAPLVAGSRGGYGLNQWTGPRRVQFEAFAADRGVSPDDLNAQLDFTLWELGNTERAAGVRLREARTAEEAARIYSDAFLRPGIPHMDRRISEAARLAGSPVSAGQTAAISGLQPPPQRQNALASTIVNYQLDPRAFMRPTNNLRQV